MIGYFEKCICACFYKLLYNTHTCECNNVIRVNMFMCMYM